MALAILILGSVACSDAPSTDAIAESDPATQTPAPATVPDQTTASSADAEQPTKSRQLEWDALIPDDYQPEKLLAEMQLDDLADDDPRAAEYAARLKTLWDDAPVRSDLDGSLIRLPGFVVPVETSNGETTGFLLVPYYGACIHVPPPPANQTVYVLTEAGTGFRPELFEVVWVTGTMSVARIENDVAEAGYTLYASSIEPYE